ncbi:MAG: tryptophan synthase subunit alpha [Gemmatimonadota bacterium]|nr:MAG: tryptophan synthase subunit alpha [Gemmatimonadota bacterium]
MMKLSVVDDDGDGDGDGNGDGDGDGDGEGWVKGKSIGEAFERCRDEGRAALIAYLAAGDPDIETTVALAGAVSEAGADVLELGIPFSDPLADGPIIQAAYTRALAGGASVKRVLEGLPRIADGSGLPIVLMTALNPVLAYGSEEFCCDAAAAGASGILVPDLLPEDGGSLRATAARAGLDTVYLGAPDTSDERLAGAAQGSTGFFYLISRHGVTGPEGGVGAGLAEQVERAKRYCSVPVAVGFGVTTADDAERIAAVADGVIVGSAFVREAAEAADREGAVEAVKRRAEELMRGIHRAATERREAKS